MLISSLGFLGERNWKCHLGESRLDLVRLGEREFELGQVRVLVDDLHALFGICVQERCLLAQDGLQFFDLGHDQMGSNHGSQELDHEGSIRW